jgi:hypothetical protein
MEELSILKLVDEDYRALLMLPAPLIPIRYGEKGKDLLERVIKSCLIILARASAPKATPIKEVHIKIFGSTEMPKNGPVAPDCFSEICGTLVDLITDDMPAAFNFRPSLVARGHGNLDHGASMLLLTASKRTLQKNATLTMPYAEEIARFPLLTRTEASEDKLGAKLTESTRGSSRLVIDAKTAAERKIVESVY